MGLDPVVKRFIFPIILAIIILVVIVVAVVKSHAATSPSIYKVERVIDGDTIVVDQPCYKTELCEEFISLIGIKIPVAGQCFADHTRLQIQSILSNSPDGVVLDRIGKSAYVFMPLTALDPTLTHRLSTNSLNFYLVKNGYAYADRNSSHKYMKDYIAAEDWAKMNHQGLWGTCQN